MRPLEAHQPGGIDRHLPEGLAASSSSIAIQVRKARRGATREFRPELGGVTSS